MIYIELFASRPPLAFQENSESFREERNVKREIFEALRHALTIGGVEETL